MASTKPADAALTFTTVALTGQQAPGAADGVTFGTIGAGAQTNRNGDLSFAATLSGPGVETGNDSGFWTGSPGSLELVAREGDSAPGTPSGAVFGQLFMPNLAEPIMGTSGGVSFLTMLTGEGVTSGNNAGFWSGTSGALQLVARTGDAAPGLPGLTIASVADHSMRNSSGLTTLETRVSGAGITLSNDDVLWQHGSGGLQVLMREGDPAPGAPAGHLFQSPVSIFAQNESGNAAFAAGTGILDSGLWIGTPGNLQPIVRTGEPAPGTPAGVNFTDLMPGVSGSFPLNAANQVAVSAGIGGTSVSSANDTGIWLGSAGALQRVAREGSAAPGVTDGAVFAHLHQQGRVALNDAGTVAFIADLTGASVSAANESGIWRGTAASLELIAREGESAPGLAVGTVHSALSQPTIARDGQIIFSGGLAGADITIANDRAIWWADELGALTMLVRKGDLFDVDDGPGEDLRTIATVGFASNVGTDNYFPLNQIPLRLSFTSGGGSGIFLATVPEPAIPAAIGLVLFPLLRRRRA